MAEGHSNEFPMLTIRNILVAFHFIAIPEFSFAFSTVIKCSIKNGRSPGLVVMGGHSSSEGTWVRIPAPCTEWTFFTCICYTNGMFI